MSSTTSLLYEQIEAELLKESNQFDIQIVDNSGTHSPYEISALKTNVFEFDYNRLVPRENDRPMDLMRFVQVASEVITDAQEREGVISAQMVQLVSQFPEDDFSRFGDEVIVWRIIHRDPASMNSKGTGRPMYGPLIFANRSDPTVPNMAITIEADTTDNIVEFSCFSKNSDIALRRAFWLEKLFKSHSWAFMVQGAIVFQWRGWGTGVYRTTGGQKLFEQPQRFFVRLVEPTVKLDPRIQHFTLEASLSNV